MTNASQTPPDKQLLGLSLPAVRNFRVSIATKLILSFLLVIVITSVVFMVVGVRLIRDRILAEAQDKVRNDLNAAREIYLNNLSHISEVVGLTAERFFLRDALASGNITEETTAELIRVRDKEGLDVLSVTDKYGYIVLRTTNPAVVSDNQGHDELVRTALYKKELVASTSIVSSQDLERESSILAAHAYFWFIETPLARLREEKWVTDGMMLKAAAPLFDSENNLLGVVYGGVLLNRNYEIVDKVKQTVYEDVVYKGQDIGTATIFQGDVRISTNVRNENGSRAIGTRVSEEVYNQVVLQGEPWIGQAYVVNNWYITAYEPIRDINNRIIGILYVGVLEQKYLDIQRQTVLTFLAITLAGALISMMAGYFIARRISIPIKKMVSASQEVAQGNLDARVEIATNDELQYLSDSFNTMATALKRRDEQLKDFATQKIMESERLALIGQLAANVAHELNNPLTGIVTFAHLLLEDHKCDNPSHISSFEIIVGQADRCKEIIRGLLDFSRQRKPDKTMCSINNLLQECVSLLENQALFHNIKIVKDFSEDLPMLVIDPSQIERVFINIILNATEAMDGNGRLTLSTHHNPLDETVEVEIADTGHGIAKEHLDQIFDPFFTTKDIGHGTGLGLAISYGIVKGHMGTISVESEVSRGTSFVIKLPINPKENGASNNGRSG